MALATPPHAPVPEVYRRALDEFFARSNADEPNDVLYSTFRIRKREQIFRFLCEAIAEHADSPVRILDLGCSEGSDLDYSLCRLTDRWRDRSAVERFEIHGIDAFEDLLELASQRYLDVGANAEFRLADITQGLPYDAAYFDIVLCSEVVEHLEEPERLLAEARRILRPGGFLILTTDNDPNVWIHMKSALRRLLRRQRLSLKDEFHRFGRKSAALTVEVNGRPMNVYGHINTRSTTDWERLVRSLGFDLVSYGRYQQVKRHWDGGGPDKLALAFGLGLLVSVLPPRIGRYFDATTALMFRSRGALP